MYDITPIDMKDSLYVQLAVDNGIISAIKKCRDDHGTGELSTLKGARDHVEALLAKASDLGLVECDRTNGYNYKYMWAQSTSKKS